MSGSALGSQQAVRLVKWLGRTPAGSRAASVISRAMPTNVRIPRTHRPTREIPDSGRPVDSDEVRRGGLIPSDKAEIEWMIRSPNFNDGTFVAMVVREADGTDRLLVTNRVPDGQPAREGKYNSHRTLRQLYRDQNGGREPRVVAAGECTVTMAGAIIGCLNQSGSYWQGNSSAEYLTDAMQAYGFKRVESSAVINFKEGGNTELGHISARESVRREAQLLRESPRLLSDTRSFTREIYERFPGDNSSFLSDEFMMGAIRVSRKPDANWPAEKVASYKHTLFFMQRLRDGTQNATFETLERIRRTSSNPDQEIASFRRYLPEFIRDAASAAD